MSDIPEHEKPVEFKLTEGTVRQDFVDGKCVGQKFICGDEVNWEDELGELIADPKHLDVYQPFEMYQPADEDMWVLIAKRLDSMMIQITAHYGLQPIAHTDLDVEQRLAELKEKLEAVAENFLVTDVIAVFDAVVKEQHCER